MDGEPKALHCLCFEGGWLFDISPKDRKARFPRWASSALPAWLMCSGANGRG